jgi:hypothetical protein
MNSFKDDFVNDMINFNQKEKPLNFVDNYQSLLYHTKMLSKLVILLDIFLGCSKDLASF